MIISHLKHHALPIKTETAYIWLQSWQWCQYCQFCAFVKNPNVVQFYLCFLPKCANHIYLYWFRTESFDFNRFWCQIFLPIGSKRMIWILSFIISARLCYWLCCSFVDCKFFVLICEQKQAIFLLLWTIINAITSSYPGWIKSPHVVTLGILKLSDLDSLTLFRGGGWGRYSGVNFGHPKSEVFQNGGGGVFWSKLWSSQIWSFPKWGGGYSGVNFGHPKSEVFPKWWGWGVGYSGVNFGHPKSEVFQNGGVFRSKLWSSQIWSFPKWGRGVFWSKLWSSQIWSFLKWGGIPE